LLFGAAFAAQAQAPQDAAKRGEYVFAAAGCYGCHTDVKGKGAPLAGGRALPTPFGTFYGPNITPHPQSGIGRWTEANFIRAMREGIRPDGSYYFPVFPYPSFTGISDADLKDLFAYLRSVAPVAQANKPHEVGFPFSWRFLQFGWRLMYFEPGPLKPDPGRPAEWNRGSYLANALGHCGECHTPRDSLGGLDHSRRFAGTASGPEGGAIPNITPAPRTGRPNYSVDDLVEVLRTGMTADGDFVGGQMGEVIAESTSKLTDADLRALATYLKALPPVENDWRPKK